MQGHDTGSRTGDDEPSRTSDGEARYEPEPGRRRISMGARGCPCRRWEAGAVRSPRCWRAWTRGAAAPARGGRLLPAVEVVTGLEGGPVPPARRDLEEPEAVEPSRRARWRRCRGGAVQCRRDRRGALWRRGERGDVLRGMGDAWWRRAPSAGDGGGRRWSPSMVKAGDRIILVHVLPKGAGAGSSHMGLWKSSGSPLIPLLEFMETNVQAGYGVSPDKEVLEILQAESKSKQVEVLAKIYWGDAREKLCEAVDDLKVDNVVLGCRGLGPLKRALLGSVSNYVVNNASCPVTVVRGPTGSTA